MRSPTRLTKGHKRLHSLVVDCGLDVDDEVEFPPYTVDIYVPELHVAIEYDGPKHDQRAQKLRDQKRDRELWETYALPVLRINHAEMGTIPKTDYYTNSEVLLMSKINKWLVENSTDVDDRRQHSLGFTGWQTT